MNISKLFFLIGYYINNTIFGKLGSKIARRRVKSYSHKWKNIQTEFGEQDTWLVVGNGPSLTSDDLEKLAHLPSVASNKITLLYEHTSWRPSLYTLADPLLLYKLKRRHYQNIDLSLLPDLTVYLSKTDKKIAWRTIPLNIGQKIFKQNGFKPDPLEQGFIAAKTITTINIQMAMWLGAKTIYIIGCDHNYKEEKHDNVKKLEHGESSNHFHPDYRKQGEIVNNAPTDIMEDGYELIQQIAVSNGIKIINITRKTALNTFERATVEEVLH